MGAIASVEVNVYEKEKVKVSQTDKRLSEKDLENVYIDISNRIKTGEELSYDDVIDYVRENINKKKNIIIYVTDYEEVLITKKDSLEEIKDIILSYDEGVWIDVYETVSDNPDIVSKLSYDFISNVESFDFGRMRKIKIITDEEIEEYCNNKVVINKKLLDDAYLDIYYGETNKEELTIKVGDREIVVEVIGRDG